MVVFIRGFTASRVSLSVKNIVLRIDNLLFHLFANIKSSKLSIMLLHLVLSLFLAGQSIATSCVPSTLQNIDLITNQNGLPAPWQEIEHDGPGQNHFPYAQIVGNT